MNELNLAAERKDYEIGLLLEENTPLEPGPLMEQWLALALEKQLPDATAFALSTCVNNQPSSRIVLLKGYENNQLHFYSNYQSAKGKALAANPLAAANFFWPTLERQIRIEGATQILPKSLSEAYFATRPRASQLSAIVSPQSQTVASREALDALKDASEKDLEGQQLVMPEHWGGYGLSAHKYEFWQGRRGRYHDRIVYTLHEGVWKRERLAP